MKILHITTNYPTPKYPIFGIFVKEQVESLEKLDNIQCDVFYCNGEGRGIRKHITYVPKIWWKILRGHYDVIHCHHVISAMILSLTGWAFFKKCVLSYQNDPDKEWGGKVFRILNIYFNRFIVKNQSPYLKYKNVTYLPNGCNADFFHPMDKPECQEKLGLEQGKIYIMYMDSNKGVRTQKRKDRYDKTLQILRDKYGYTNIESIELRNTPREFIPLYINACDLHLMSSDFEGSPNSVKECMCCNTPVVSTPVGNVAEMIGDIDGAYVTKTFTAEELAECVDKVLRSDKPFESREKFIAKGYGMGTVARKLYSIYNNL